MCVVLVYVRICVRMRVGWWTQTQQTEAVNDGRGNNVLQCVAVCCIVLQCVAACAVCCSVSQCDVARCSVHSVF